MAFNRVLAELELSREQGDPVIHAQSIDAHSIQDIYHVYIYAVDELWNYSQNPYTVQTGTAIILP